jgi:integrase/recombinase XerD
MVVTLTEQNLSRLLQAVPDRSLFGARDRALMQFLVQTGLRVGELVGLRAEHVASLVDRKVRSLLVLPATICKGGHGRTIPLNRAAQLAVRDILKFNQARGFGVTAGDPLLYTKKHQAMTVRQVQRLIQGYRHKAGLEGITPHKFRHLFACRVLNGGATARQLQVLLGHRWLNTVEVYTHVNPAELARAVSRLPA